MEEFVISFAVILIVVLAMGVGVWFGKTGIKGSCGGLNALVGLGLRCDGCSEPCESHDTIHSSCPTRAHDFPASRRSGRITSNKR